MEREQLEFVADKVIAQEVALGLLLNALQQRYPEVTEKLMDGLAHVLQASPLPTPGSRANLMELQAALAENQPTGQAGH